jgi:hypothetical protein
LAGAEGRPEVPMKWLVAARLYGAAEAFRETISLPRPLTDRADGEHHTNAVRTALGEEAFAAAWAAGRALSLEQAVVLALEEA